MLLLSGSTVQGNIPRTSKLHHEGSDMTSIITFAANKGGVGKTTISATIAHTLALSGQRVLAVDLDPQGNMTSALGGPDDLPGFADVIRGESQLIDVIVTTEPGVDLLAPGRGLVAAGQALVTEPGGERVLRRALATMPEPYEVIVIDTPPDLGRLTLNGVAAATHVVAIINPARWAAEGGVTISALCQQVRDLELGSPVFLGAIVNKVPGGKRLVRDAVMGSLESTDITLFETRIPERSSLEQAEFISAPITHVDPGGREAKLFKALADELNKKIAASTEAES